MRVLGTSSRTAMVEPLATSLTAGALPIRIRVPEIPSDLSGI